MCIKAPAGVLNFPPPTETQQPTSTVVTDEMKEGGEDLSNGFCYELCLSNFTRLKHIHLVGKQ